VNYDNSLVVAIRVTCNLLAPSSGDHLFTCGAIYLPPHYRFSTIEVVIAVARPFQKWLPGETHSALVGLPRQLLIFRWCNRILFQISEKSTRWR